MLSSNLPRCFCSVYQMSKAKRRKHIGKYWPWLIITKAFLVWMGIISYVRLVQRERVIQMYSHPFMALNRSNCILHTQSPPKYLSNTNTKYSPIHPFFWGLLTKTVCLTVVAGVLFSKGNRGFKKVKIVVMLTEGTGLNNPDEWGGLQRIVPRYSFVMGLHHRTQSTQSLIWEDLSASQQYLHFLLFLTERTMAMCWHCVEILLSMSVVMSTTLV